MSNFLEEQQRKLEGFQANVQNIGSGFKTVRFYLDKASTKDDFQGTNRFLFPFKSFWVYGTNNTSFKANIVVNPAGDAGDSLPLRMNMSIPFEYRQNGCALEFPAQAGVYVDIAFGLNSDINPGFIQLDSSGSTVISEGSNFTDTNPSINNSGTSVILAANSGRKVGFIQNNSGQPIWVGSTASLASVDYAKKCQRVNAGDTFIWKNSAQLFARVETTTTADIAVMELV